MPALGPHYLHPALLSRGTVFAFPAIGLALSAVGEGPNGGILLVYSEGGSGFMSLEVDPASGALLEERIGYAGVGTVIYRRLP